MLITGLSYAVNGSEVDVYIDNGGTSRLLLDSIAEFKLYQGKVITEEDYEEIISKDIELRLFRKALNYISIRPRTEYELNIYFLKQRLLNENANRDDIIERLFAKLREQKYVNDEKFCEWLIENRVNCSLKSRAEIKNELQQKGVSSSIIANQLTAYYSDEEEQEVFDKIFEKKYGTKTSLDKKEQLKIYNYFQRRGFSYQIIKNKLNI
jgi:regulatory protein